MRIWGKKRHAAGNIRDTLIIATAKKKREGKILTMCQEGFWKKVEETEVLVSDISKEKKRPRGEEPHLCEEGGPLLGDIVNKVKLTITSVFACAVPGCRMVPYFATQWGKVELSEGVRVLKERRGEEVYFRPTELGRRLLRR